MSEWDDLMRRGDFEGAWKLSDRSVRCEGDGSWRHPRHLQKVWNGASLEGRRVLIRCYHGLGDTLQFIRYHEAVTRIARSVSIWIQPALIAVLRDTVKGSRLLPLHDGSPDVEYDVDVEIMELPHVFRTTVATIPAAVPYIVLPRPAKSRRTLVAGVAWRAGEWDTNRSIPFDLVARLPAFREMTVIPLLPMLTAAEARSFPGWQPRSTVDDLARQIVECDLVVTVDTMAAHLAGALGIPTYTVLKHHADWRWLAGRSDTPWYPSMRLYRQLSPGEWADPLARLNRDLLDVIASSHRASAAALRTSRAARRSPMHDPRSRDRAHRRGPHRPS